MLLSDWVVSSRNKERDFETNGVLQFGSIRSGSLHACFETTLYDCWHAVIIWGVECQLPEWACSWIVKTNVATVAVTIRDEEGVML